MTRELVILSLPGAFGRWLTERTMRAVSKAGLVPKVVYVDRHDAIAQPDDESVNVVIYVANYPGKGLLQRVIEAELPVIAAVQPAMDCVSDMCATVDVSFMQALRANTASAALITRFAYLPQTTLLYDEGRAQRVAGLLLAASSAFELPAETFKADVDAEMLLDAAILSDIGEDRTTYEDRANLNERAVILTQGVLTPIVQSMLTREQQTICWPYDVFLSGDALDSPAGVVADITGPARVLYYGPYCHVPDGVWDIKMILGFSDDISDMSFSVEVHCNGLLQQGSLRPTQGGLFSAAMTVQFEHAEEPVEIRISSEAGAIEGRMALGQFEFTPMGDGS